MGESVKYFRCCKTNFLKIKLMKTQSLDEVSKFVSFAELDVEGGNSNNSFFRYHLQEIFVMGRCK